MVTTRTITLCSRRRQRPRPLRARPLVRMNDPQYLFFVRCPSSITSVHQPKPRYPCRPAGNAIYVRTSMKFKDTAKSFNWLGDLALCQGSTFETCTWVPSTKGYFESNLLVSANDCTRWFTDHHYEYTAHGTGACYATGSTTHRCFSVGICNPTEGTRPNVKMYKLAWATKRWVVEWVGLGLLIVTTAL